MLLVNYRENGYKLLAWRYLDHVGEQYRQWLPGYRRLLDTINRPYETIMEIVVARTYTHSPCGYGVAWPFRGCGGNWHKIRPPLPPNHFDLRLLTSAFFPVMSTDIRLLLFDFFSKKAVRGSIDLQYRLNLPVPVTGAAETPAEAAVIFPSRIQSTFDLLELKSGLLNIRLLEVNFQLRVGLQKVEKGMYNPNFRSQLG